MGSVRKKRTAAVRSRRELPAGSPLRRLERTRCGACAIALRSDCLGSRRCRSDRPPERGRCREAALRLGARPLVHARERPGGAAVGVVVTLLVDGSKRSRPTLAVWMAAAFVVMLLLWAGFILTGLRRLAEEYPVAISSCTRGSVISPLVYIFAGAAAVLALVFVRQPCSCTARATRSERAQRSPRLRRGRRRARGKDAPGDARN